jgi:GAF domain-containing protein
LDDVLRAIVLRARKLLGTDVAYLSLHDEAAGDTYTRVTAGSVSAKFQRVRPGMGEGLGGLVAQTASPYATADYFNDERFRHTRPIDSAVYDDGLVAILGVPLLAGGEVIGVLSASDREVRPFTRDEVALLSSLATHAAIAIELANQLAETKAVLADLAEASRVIRELSAAVERAAARTSPPPRNPNEPERPSSPSASGCGSRRSRRAARSSARSASARTRASTRPTSASWSARRW